MEVAVRGEAHPDEVAQPEVQVVEGRETGSSCNESYSAPRRRGKREASESRSRTPGAIGGGGRHPEHARGVVDGAPGHVGGCAGASSTGGAGMVGDGRVARRRDGRAWAGCRATPPEEGSCQPGEGASPVEEALVRQACAGAPGTWVQPAGGPPEGASAFCEPPSRRPWIRAGWQQSTEARRFGPPGYWTGVPPRVTTYLGSAAGKEQRHRITDVQRGWTDEGSSVLSCTQWGVTGGDLHRWSHRTRRATHRRRVSWQTFST